MTWKKGTAHKRLTLTLREAQDATQTYGMGPGHEARAREWNIIVSCVVLQPFYYVERERHHYH